MNIPKIDLKGGDFLDMILDILAELGHLRKRRVELKVIGKLVYPNGRIESVKKTLINESETFCYVPMLNRVWFITKIHEENNKRIVYLPYFYHKTLDMNKIQLPIKYTADMHIYYMRKWIKTKIENIIPTLDLNLMDNELSPNLIADAHSVLKTKSLEFLAEVPRKTWILSLIIVGLICGIMGSIITIIGGAIL